MARQLIIQLPLSIPSQWPIKFFAPCPSNQRVRILICRGYDQIYPSCNPVSVIFCQVTGFTDILSNCLFSICGNKCPQTVGNKFVESMLIPRRNLSFYIQQATIHFHDPYPLFKMVQGALQGSVFCVIFKTFFSERWLLVSTIQD